MIVAQGHAKKGPVLILGMSAGNVTRLIGGEPIVLTQEKHRLPPECGEICIVYGVTEEAIAEQLKVSGMMNEKTVVHVDPRLK